VSVRGELAPLLRLRWAQLFVLAALLVVVGTAAMELKFSVLDLDVWWHLKSGDWIVQHAAFPHTGILSRTAADRPWAAYSWGYEVLLSRFYAWFGLLGVGIYGTALTVLVALAVYWMVRSLCGRFWPACLLASVASYAFLFTMMPRPVFFSIMLCCATLTLILQAQGNDHVQTLYWLPLFFLFWVNLHIQFIYGLAIVAVFVAATIGVHLAEHLGVNPELFATPKFRAGTLLGVFGACFLATLIGPYSYHVYGVILGYSRSQLIYSIVQELQPLSFRASNNYVELLLGGAAFVALGWQKKLDLFKLLLLVMANMVAFRTMRDSWFLCVIAAACIADTLGADAEPEPRESPLELGGVLVSVLVILLLFASTTDFTLPGIDRAISGRFPVMASNFVHQNRLPGPIYNTFDWGGFLTWYMPEYPVSIDGRTDLYGDALTKLLVDTQTGAGPYTGNPYLGEARLVLLHRQDGLASALRVDPHYRKVYEDQLTVLFVRE
jgi:hypothetical protein